MFNALRNSSQVIPKVGAGRVEQIQSGIGDRLSALRENREALTTATAAPVLRDIGEQEATAKRRIGLEGSLGERRRADIGMSADIARQQVQSQALESQIQSEVGLQQLQNEFTSMFAQMSQTDFSQALSGLGEEIDQYMAEKGRSLRYDQLATQAQESAANIAGRMFSAMSQESTRSGNVQRQNELAYERGEYGG